MSALFERAIPLSSLTLIRASKKQTLQSRKNTWPQWGEPNGFSLERYVARDEAMENCEWSANNLLTTWALVRRDDLTSTDLIAHCETYRREVLVLAPGSKTPTKTIGYGIASVFTPPQYRKGGMARHMLSLLHSVIGLTEKMPKFPVELWGEPPVIEGVCTNDGTFSVLYSDVGNFYSKCYIGSGELAQPGWLLATSIGSIWELPVTAEVSKRDDWVWLDTEGVTKFEDQLAKDMENSMSQFGDSSKTRIAFLPDQGLLTVHSVRNNLTELGNTRTYGRCLSDTPDSPTPNTPFFSYTYSKEHNPPGILTLLVLYVQHPVPFSVVQEAARREGCERIEVWGDRCDKVWPGGKVNKREDHLAALATYDIERGFDNTEWLFNEKYAWC